MGRASMPPSVLSWRNVNWVARNSKASGFSTWIAWVVGVSGREYTTWILNPLGGPANARSPIWLETQNTTAVFRDSGRKERHADGGDPPGNSRATTCKHCALSEAFGPARSNGARTSGLQGAVARTRRT